MVKINDFSFLPNIVVVYWTALYETTQLYETRFGEPELKNVTFT